MNTANKTVLITGCSSGIGQAAATHFATHGWNVVATMRNPQAGTELAKYPNVRVVALDVTSRASAEQAVQGALAEFGRIDVVVNNAGYGVFGPFETASEEVIDKQFQTNINGIFNVTRAVLPAMRAQHAGVIINVSSIGGLSAFPLFSLYHATKFAVVGFSESLQFELAPFGIQIKVIAPGGVKTDFASRSLVHTFDNDEHAYTDTVTKVQQAFAARRSSGEYSSSEMLAEAIFGAATDGTDRLRYVVGPDAEQIAAARKQMSDEAYVAMINQRMGLVA
jgi:NAD(P)-dependent dehydrogenase (short-subunit alcohol dehydrogenase family)